MKKTFFLINILLPVLLLAGLAASFYRITTQEKTSYYKDGYS